MEQHPQAVTQPLLPWVRLVLRYRWLVVGAALIPILVMGLWTVAGPVQYDGSVLLTPANMRRYGVLEEPVSQSRLLRTEIEVINSTAVLERAAGLASDADISTTDLRDSLTVENRLPSLLVEITVRRRSASEASKLATTVSNAYQEERTTFLDEWVTAVLAELEAEQTELRDQYTAAVTAAAAAPDDVGLAELRDLAEQQLTDSTTRASTIRVDYASVGTGAQVLETATSERVDRPAFWAGIGALVGMLAALVAIWIRYTIAPVITGPDEPQALLQLPLLGEPTVASDPAALPFAAAGSDAAADYGYINATLESSGYGPGSTVVLTGGQQASAVAVNLAADAARRGEDALLIVPEDSPVTGWAAIGSMDGTEVSAWQIDADTQIGVLVVPASVEEALPTVTRGRSGVTFVDSGSMLDTASAVRLVQMGDVAMIVAARWSPLRDLELTRDRLALGSVPVIGYVFTDAPQSRRRTPRSEGDVPDAAPDAPVPAETSEVTAG